MKKSILILSGLFIISCSTDMPVNTLNTVPATKIANTTITGKTAFPSQFTTKGTLGGLANYATVSIINLPTATPPHKTIATGLTDANGVFTINPDPGFDPSVNDIFVLEAAKRFGSAGYDLITIRTLIKWTGSGWQSMTKHFTNNTWPVLINSKTTALTNISDLNPNITAPDTIGTIDVSSGSSVPTDIDIEPDGTPEVSVTEINQVTGIVDSLLSYGVDSTQFLIYQNGNYTIRKEAPQRQLLIDTNTCTYCFLGGEDFSNQDLSGANLEGAVLTGANLDGTTLSNAIVKGANFTNVDMTAIKGDGGTVKNFYNFDFSNANLTGANLYNANLDSTNFSGASLDSANLGNTSLYNALLAGATVTGTNFANVNMTVIKGSGNVLNNFSNFDFSNANLTYVNLYNANLTGADLTGVNLSNADLYTSTLINTNLTDANLTSANLTGANLTGANVTGINLTSANLSGATWTDGTICTSDNTWDGICHN